MDQKEKTKQYNREYYHRVRKLQKTDEERDKLRAYHKQWREKNKVKFSKYQTCYRYGISLEKYDEMMSVTNCPICGIEFDSTKSRHKKNIDHCHDTGIIRGVLCHHCNLALGWFDHDVERLRKAINWLKTD